MLRKLITFFQAASRRSTFERNMDDELRFHVDSRAAELTRRGLSPAEAARRARVELGSVEKYKEEARASFGLRLLDEVRGDLHYALRTFLRNKVFTAAAVATLALGIGANAAIFNLIDALMLRSLPVSRPERLLQLKLAAATDPVGDPSLSYPLVLALDAERDIFAGIAGFTGFPFSTGNGDTLRRLPGALVTGAFYDTLGLTPAAGRLLTRDDDRPDAPLVAVASYGYWERQFAGSLEAIGQTILLNGVPVTIVGVSPRGFVGANVGAVADVTVPVAAIPRLSPDMASLVGRGNTWLRVLGRLRPGVTPEQASARLGAEWPRISEPAIDPKWPSKRKESISGAVIRMAPGATGWTYLREMYVKPLRVMMAAVSVVLLIACANVASLLLARASARRREIAVRMAIGAGRARVVRQLLVESAALALIGAACGIGLATAGGSRLVGLISTGGSPLVFDLTPNWRILAFTTAVAMATALLFGLAPAMQSTATGAAPALKDDARTGSARSRLLPSLVTAQLALSLVLLIGAALFVRTLRNLQTLDPGFRPQGVLLVDLERRGGAVPPAVIDTLRSLPGVQSASVSTHTPLSGSTWSEPVVPVGQPLPERDNALFVGAGPGFFGTIGVGLVSGREFTERDTSESPTVAIVNERYAQQHFPNQNPVGQRLITTLNGTRRELEIVGVARNTSAAGLRRTPPAVVYVAYAQLRGNNPATVTVRVAGSIAEASAAILRTVQPLSPTRPLEIRALSAQVQSTIAQERMMAALAGCFGLLALVLASIGVYGLLAYGVARRTREIGIRVALGAQRKGVIALILSAAWRPILVGLAIGLPAAWAASRWIESLLFGMNRTDPAAIVAAVLLLVTVAHLAAFVPALRASRVDPLVALRHE